MADETRQRITPAVIAEWKKQPGGLTAEQMRMIGKSLADNVNAYLAVETEKERLKVTPALIDKWKVQPGGLTAEHIHMIGGSFAANATAALQREKADRERISETPSDPQSEAPRSDPD